MGGSSRSRSVSTQTQQSIALDDSSIRDSGSAQNAEFFDIKGVGGDASIQVINKGVQPEVVAEVIDRLALAQVQTAREIRSSTEPLADIASTITGTQTETGRIIGMLAVPAAVVVVGGAAAFAWLKK